MLKSRVLIQCICLIILMSGWLMVKSQSSQERPNILFLIVDDWSYPHASAYGDQVVATPTFDRIANEGMLFHHAYTAVSSCTPSRAAILTGQAIHRLEEGGVLFAFLPVKFPNYTMLLEEAGYTVGSCKKSWGPGSYEKGGYSRNPAGEKFDTYQEFFEEALNKDAPFCFWYGGFDSHRPYEAGTGAAAGMDIDAVTVPGYLPDVPEIRTDMLDYFFEVNRYDQEVAGIISLLEANGELDNTLIVYTSDNGMPFPRAKSTCYDSGTRMPLAIRWPGVVEAGMEYEGFVSFTDFAPTFLEAAGLPIPEIMTGRSMFDIFRNDDASNSSARGRQNNHRNAAFFEKERHAAVREGNIGYPTRAVRTKNYLYIRNLKPDRWPAGDPEKYISQGAYGDIDASPSLDYLLQHRSDENIKFFFELSTAKKPYEELYDVRNDPDQLHNVAGKAEYQRALKMHRQHLNNWLVETADPRYFDEDYQKFDKYPYYNVRLD